MLTTVGRLCVRKGKTVGVYFPFSASPAFLDSGIYEIREVMGELSVVYVGQPAMSDDRYQGLSANELVHEPSCALTASEYDKAIALGRTNEQTQTRLSD